VLLINRFLFPLTQAPSDRKRRCNSEPLCSSATHKRHRVLEDLVAELQDRVEQLEKTVQQLAHCTPSARTPCRYNTEEEEDIHNKFHDTLEERVLGVQVELEDKVLDNSEDVIDQKIESRLDDLKADIFANLISALEYANRRNQR
jgi:hypothetical protein